MIKISSLSVRYEKKSNLVLKDIDFHLEEGKIGILIGPNGAGKSTLLKSICGLLPLKEGNIIIDKKPLNEFKPRERAKKIAYVPQILSFEPASVYDTVMLGRLPYFSFVPGQSDHEVVTKTLEELNLLHLKDRNVIQLSGGERQKIAIARALAQQSQIIVFDEPTSNLDIAGEELIASYVEILAKEYKKTVLLAVHDLNLAYRLGDTFLFLKEGKSLGVKDKEGFTPEIIEETFGVNASKIDTEDGSIFIIKGEKR